MYDRVWTVGQCGQPTQPRITTDTDNDPNLEGDPGAEMGWALPSCAMTHRTPCKGSFCARLIYSRPYFCGGVREARRWDPSNGIRHSDCLRHLQVYIYILMPRWKTWHFAQCSYVPGLCPRCQITWTICRMPGNLQNSKLWFKLPEPAGHCIQCWAIYVHMHCLNSL